MRKNLTRIIAAVLILLFALVALASLITSIQVVDRDNDGLSDSKEKEVKTNPLIQDTDQDGIKDGVEYNYWMNRSINEHRDDLAPTGDVDHDGIINILDYDSDNDGLSDGKELEIGTDPANQDTDEDGLSDGDEIAGCTDPRNPDTDGDGISDGQDQTPKGGSQSSDSGYGVTSEQDKKREPSRYGGGGNPVCIAVFNPSLDKDRLKRYMTYDSVATDYSVYIADETLRPLKLSDRSYENVFNGIISLREVTMQLIAIPSVAPDANIISYTSSVPNLHFEFFKDEADNYYVEADRYFYGSDLTLTIHTSSNSSYYIYDIPAAASLHDIPVSVKHTPAESVRSSAALIIDKLGLTGQTNIKNIVSTMYDYFGNFTAGDIPTAEEEPNPYLAIARSKHGACYPRSYAFFVTANSLGLPTRLVTNECHAFVEIWIPPKGWMMLDLGGLGECTVCNPSGYEPFGGLRQPKKTGGSGSGGDGGTEPDNESTAPRLPTTTTITDVSVSSYKGGSFTTIGVVEDGQQRSIGNMNVDVFVNRTKHENGVLAGTGTTGSNGVFIIQCNVPDSVEVGTNQVVAHAKGNKTYAGSWSDPPITIYSNTTLRLDMVDSVGRYDELVIKGQLTDAGNLPLKNRPVLIYWNTSYVSTVTTSEDGEFLITYTPQSLGVYRVSASFDGDQYLTNSSDNKDIVVKDMSTRMTINVTPTIAQRTTTLFIHGILISGANETMANASIAIYYDTHNLANASTSSNGVYMTTVKIPKNSTLGNVTVRAWYQGTTYFAEASANQQIRVHSKTQLALHLLPKEIHQNMTIYLTGILTDDVNKPVVSARIHLLGVFIDTNASTTQNGSFNASVRVPAKYPLGTTNVVATYTGSLMYLESQNHTSITILAVGSVMSIDMTYIIIGGVLAIIIIILAVFFLRKQKKRIEIQRSLEEIIAETLSRLQTGQDYRKTVLDCYKKMCELLMMKGIIKNAAQTPREFALVAKHFLRVSPESLYDLTKVFEKARYSEHEISEREKAKAIRCLSEIVFAPVHGIRRKPTVEVKI